VFSILIITFMRHESEEDLRSVGTVFNSWQRTSFSGLTMIATISKLANRYWPRLVGVRSSKYSYKNLSEHNDLFCC